MNYLKVMREAVPGQALLKPITKALTALKRHAEQEVRLWIPGLRRIFQVA
ncbi:hypothetical protein M8009_14695 [Halomonas sp. ATCH28]|uniref:Uncharacterized protein n=1 Tax=Halomonas gemina TaxID=2945105 RepID=A0ABT0T3N4_9GAMM|nr:hypothetical protein [Halomonas gemina]MCL7941535.1 hypothetical protein [Halomonas gemina]